MRFGNVARRARGFCFAWLAAVGAGCGGGEPGEVKVRPTHAAPAPRPDDAPRIGRMLERDGLLNDREVQAMMTSYVYRVNSRQMRKDSADAAFRAWLEAWVRSHPERVEIARRMIPAPASRPGHATGE